MKQALKSSFLQLITLYTILIALVNFGIFNKYTLHFEIFALFLGILGALTIEEKESLKINTLYLIIPILIVFVFRIIPYINNNIPLGYDTGIYKYTMETYFQNLPTIPKENIDSWIKSGFPPGLFVITDILYLIGFDSQTILTFVFIFFELLLGLTIYISASKFFGKEVGIISFFIYSISMVQFKVFWYMYYKNVVALFIMLIAIYFLKSKKEIPFVITSVFIGALHRPTFLIFGLIYLCYIIYYRGNFIKNLLIGIIILLLTITFYIHNIAEAILSNIEPIATANIGAGTFISFFTYQFSSLSYLPFSLLGFLVFVKNKDLNPFFFWFLICGIIVYFKIIFFNRFIIHLDIVMIILASFGFYELIKSNKKIGSVIFLVLFVSSLFVMNQNIKDVKPLITEKELNIIKRFNDVEKDAYILSTSSYYSPWILGYSGRKTIAPGLFDYDKWSFEEWMIFWETGDKEKAVQMLEIYDKPLYIYIGKEMRQINEEKFKNECFKKSFQDDGIKVYKFIC